MQEEAQGTCRRHRCEVLLREVDQAGSGSSCQGVAADAPADTRPYLQA